MSYPMSYGGSAYGYGMRPNRSSNGGGMPSYGGYRSGGHGGRDYGMGGRSYRDREMSRGDRYNDGEERRYGHEDRDNGKYQQRKQAEQERNRHQLSESNMQSLSNSMGYQPRYHGTGGRSDYGWEHRSPSLTSHRGTPNPSYGDLPRFENVEDVYDMGHRPEGFNGRNDVQSLEFSGAGSSRRMDSIESGYDRGGAPEYQRWLNGATRGAVPPDDSRISKRYYSTGNYSGRPGRNY